MRRRLSLVLFFFVLGSGLIATGVFIIVVAATPVPSISSFDNRQVNQSTRIYDRTGQVLLFDYNRDSRRSVVPLSSVSPNAINAVLAIEDSSFYGHGGVRITSLIRAMVTDLLGVSLTQGGSTITQQVVKNTLLTGKKSVTRKIHELILAIKLDENYSKDQILETYLNNISYGGTIYGIEAAAESYFGKTAKDLSVAESAYLAAMIQAPSYFSPYGSHRTDLVERKNLVLERMLSLGFINNAAYAASVDENVSFATAGQSTIIAPHFVFYVLGELESEYGASALVSGLKVTTTLDAALEAKMESIVRQYIADNGEKFNASNASLVAIDPTSGQILAMVGSRNFFDKEIDGQYNASLALRQPGSTMKPFVYSLALMRGYTRNTVVFDVPTQFSTQCRPSDIFNNTQPCYAPRNHDNSFRGPMTFESALAQSINIPAIKVLYLVGIQNAVNLAKSFGLGTLGDPNQYGLTLVLGGGEVRLLDLVGAYAVFANDGVKNTPTGILEVSDTGGNVLQSFSLNPTRVIPETIARDMSAMLSDAPARVPGYSLNSVLTIPGYEVAVKTGTTNDTRDAWTVGYTPSMALGVWFGNNDNSPMNSLAGLIAAPMWHQAMLGAISEYPKKYFGEPGLIYSSSNPILQGDWRMPDATGSVVPHSILYWTDKENPNGPPPPNPSQDPQYPYWEYGVNELYSSRPELFSGELKKFVPVSIMASTTQIDSESY